MMPLTPFYLHNIYKGLWIVISDVISIENISFSMLQNKCYQAKLQVVWLMIYG